jgi:hypothetical protein
MVIKRLLCFPAYSYVDAKDQRQTLVHTHRSPKEAIPHIKPNLPFKVMDILQNTVDVKSQPVPLNHPLPVLKNTLQVQYAQ